MGSEVRIPFLWEWKDRMLEGKKTATSRSRLYGKAGDRFQCFGATFEIVSWEMLTLEDIAYNHFKEEGVDCPADFKAVWARLHPSGFKPDKEVVFHKFKRVQ